MPNGKVSRRNRQEPQIPASSNGTLESVHMQEIYQGPMPHPDTLKGFGEIDLSFPERIMKMAEAHNDADVKTKLRLSLANLMIPIIGQVFTLLITGGGIIACVFLAIAGKYGESVAAIILSFAPIIINALTNLKNKQR